jgi:indole-3-pyruvate monooxygenase
LDYEDTDGKCLSIGVPQLPAWCNQKGFLGRVLHSSAYRNGEPFRNQRVLVVGLGNSGGEIAIDLCEHGARVAIAVRSAINIVPRDICGLPIVTISIALSRLPGHLADLLAAPLLRLTLGDSSRLGFRKPALGPISQIKRTGRIPLIDIGTVGLIRSGRIEVLRGVRSLNDGGVEFDDGSTGHFDALKLATGYRPGTERFLGPADALRANVAGRWGTESRSGLYLCGFSVSPNGMLRDIAREARWIASQVASRRDTQTA